MKRRRALIIMAVVLVIVLLVLYAQHSKEKLTDVKIDYELYEATIDDYKSILFSKNSQDIAVVANEKKIGIDSIVYDKWVLTYRMEQKNRTDKEFGLYQNYHIKQYDIKTKKLVHEYDISNIVKQYGEKLRISGIDQLRKNSETGEYLLEISISTDAYSFNQDYILINLEDYSHAYMNLNKMEDSTMDLILKNQDYNNVLSVLGEWPQDKKFAVQERNGIPRSVTFTPYFENQSYINLKGDNLPEKNKQLYQMFPDLKKYIGDETKDIYIILDNTPSAEELLQLLKEEGEEVFFPSLILPADKSIDGQEHQITSFEDYYKWRAFDKEETPSTSSDETEISSSN